MSKNPLSADHRNARPSGDEASFKDRCLTAVLFLGFNRPNTTARVFEAIRRAQPARLYVALDGPRQEKAGEREKVSKVREIVTTVDWPCELRTFFRSENLGCKVAVNSAIDWFFEHEPDGIILEDDCLPSDSFFEYCQALLSEYREDKGVWHIGGNNFGIAERCFEDRPYSFSSLAQVWGWATWRDRWQQREMNPFALIEEARNGRQWELSRAARLLKIRDIRRVGKGLDTWDYQWQVTILNNVGLCVYPRKNLITNIGDGPDATHTKVDRRAHLPRGKLTLRTGSGSGGTPVHNRKLTRYFEKQMGLRSKRAVAHEFKVGVKTRLWDALMWSVRATLRNADFAIVVASTGRAGSTMLFSAIARSWVNARRTSFSSLIPDRWIVASVIHAAWRLDRDRIRKGNLYKTHDLPSEQLTRRDVRTVFVFGDPIDSINSVCKMTETHGALWFDEHLWHLRSRGRFEDLFKEDVLGYANQLDSWASFECAGVLALKYDGLWQAEEAISEHLGFKVRLPPYRGRSTRRSNPHEVDDAILRLRDKYHEAPTVVSNRHSPDCGGKVSDANGPVVEPGARR